MSEYPLKDKEYDLISLLYHTSQGVEVCKQYAKDAEAAGDTQAAHLFKEAMQSYNEIGTRAKNLLGSRIAGSGPMPSEPLKTAGTKRS